MKRKFWIPALIVVVAVAGLTWWLMQRRGADRQLVLYGNIDLRQVQLAFNNSERIAAVLVQEGDHVKQGQVLARLDTSRLEPQVAQADSASGGAAASRNPAEKRQPAGRDRAGARQCRVGQGRSRQRAAAIRAAEKRRGIIRRPGRAPTGRRRRQSRVASCRSKTGGEPKVPGFSGARPAQRRYRRKRSAPARQRSAGRAIAPAIG